MDTTLCLAIQDIRDTGGKNLKGQVPASGLRRVGTAMARVAHYLLILDQMMPASRTPAAPSLQLVPVAKAKAAPSVNYEHLPRISGTEYGHLPGPATATAIAGPPPSYPAAMRARHRGRRIGARCEQQRADGKRLWRINCTRALRELSTGKIHCSPPRLCCSRLSSASPFSRSSGP